MCALWFYTIFTVDYNDFRLINLEGLVILEVYFGVFMQFIFFNFFFLYYATAFSKPKGLAGGETKEAKRPRRGETKEMAANKKRVHEPTESPYQPRNPCSLSLRNTPLQKEKWRRLKD
jgi:hypothetical protein